MQSLQELIDDFSLPGVLAFDEPHPGMPRALVTTPACTAEFYLPGAHLTRWQPVGQAPGLFLSEASAYTPGKAIRGGVPVIFPWFGAPETSAVPVTPGSAQHGFARTATWTLSFAGLAGDDVHLSARLDQTEAMHALGFSGFELVYEAILGATLTIRLSVFNIGQQPFLFEEALHAYLAVGDSREVTVEGLQGTDYLDKTDEFKRKTQTADLLRFDGEIDRPYLNTTAPLSLWDPVLHRRLALRKENSATTVTWNPGDALAAKLADLTPGTWPHFVCLETANLGEDAITLQPNQAHRMEMRLALLSETAEPL